MFIAGHQSLTRIGSLQRGIKVTNPVRTLIDVAPRLGLPLLERTLDEGLLQRKWAIADIRRRVAAAPHNHPGSAALRGLIALRTENPSADSAL